MSALGTIGHLILGRGGESDNPLISNWESNEAAIGGFLGASGIVPAEVIRAKPNVYQEGARWRSYHVETGHCVWGGRLAAPTIEGNVGHLIGKGWGELFPEREVHAGLYETRDTSVFAALDDSTNSDGQHSAFIGNGRLHFRRDKADTLGADSIVWLAARFEPDVEIYYMSFDTHVSGAGDIHTFGIGIYNADAEVMFEHDFTAGDADASWEVDFTVDTGATPRQPSNYIGIQGTGDGLEAMSVSLYNLRISGIKDGGDLTDGGLVRDIADKCNISVISDDKGVSVLPYYPGVARVGDLLDRACLVSGYNARFIDHGAGPVLRYRGWGENRWQILDPRQPENLQRMDAFDRLVLAYTEGETDQRTFVRMKLDPSPLEDPATYGPVDIPEKWADTDSIHRVADNLLQKLSKERYSGDAHWAEVYDSDQILRSAHLVHAGDIAYEPLVGVNLKISELRRTDAGVFPQFGNEIEAVIQRVLGREFRRLRQRR